MNRLAVPTCLSGLLGLGLLSAPATAAAQDGDPSHRPEWKVRPDRPGADASQVSFVDMPPGWHVATGPSAILWDPAVEARGTFRVELESYLFDPDGRREAFGLFVGGSDLEGEGQRYLYFLVREGGEFTLKRRLGGDTADVIPWSSNGAIASYASRAPDAATAHNVLALEARRDEVVLFVNDQEVARVPRGDLPLDGTVGLRVNHRLNLHITRLDVLPRGG